MRVLMYSYHRGEFSGGPKSVLLTARALREQGLTPFIVTSGCSALDHAARSEGFAVQSLSGRYRLSTSRAPRSLRRLFRLISIPATAAKLRHIVRTVDPACLWTRGIPTILILGPNARLSGLPLVCDVGAEPGLVHAIAPLRLALMRQCSLIVCQAPSIARAMSKKRYSTRMARTTYLLPPLEPPIGRNYHRRAPQLSPIPKPPSTNAPQLISIGTITKRKRQDLLLRALAELTTEYPNLAVTFVGSSSEKAYARKLTRLVHSLDLIANVTFSGWQDDTSSLLQYSTALIHTGTNEGIPHTIREAMTAAVPVVAPRAGSITDVITDRDTGYLFRAGDVHDLARCIRHLLASPEEARAIGRRAKAYADQAFSWQDWGHSYAQMVREAIVDRTPTKGPLS